MSQKLLSFVQQLREAGVDFKVYKNTMTRRATEEAELSELNEILRGPTALRFMKMSL